jgi:hypothetical protein
MLAHHFSHYYNRRYIRMVPKMVGVINPTMDDTHNSCYEHTDFINHVTKDRTFTGSNKLGYTQQILLDANKTRVASV